MIVTAVIEAVPGDKVMVENYRSKHKYWEEGEVRHTEIDVRKDGTTRVSYHVWVERPGTKRQPWKTGYSLHVGDDKIRKI